MREFGGTWSESKLDCVEQYADSYLNVMQKQRWCRLEYVDAFAGRGRQTLKSGSQTDEAYGDASEQADAQEFLIGSALRALRASDAAVRGFDRFEFIEADKASCDELNATVANEFAGLRSRVHVICGDANDTLREYVRSVDWKNRRALVFLDPFGLEVGWDLVLELAGTKACDVWYLFPLGGVIRMLTKNGTIPDLWSTRLDTLFGTHDWRKEFYKPNPQMSFFAGKDLLRDASTDHVVDYLRRQLGVAFSAVSQAAILRNSKGAPLFVLVLGVSNPSQSAQKAALAIANHLVKRLNEA
jgi:three-Cys-motif partner protein